MKKLLALILALIAALSLCACGNDSNTNPDTNTDAGTNGSTPATSDPGQTSTINLNDYVKYAVVELNGKEKSFYHFDAVALVEDHADKVITQWDPANADTPLEGLSSAKIAAEAYLTKTYDCLPNSVSTGPDAKEYTSLGWRWDVNDEYLDELAQVFSGELHYEDVSCPVPEAQPLLEVDIFSCPISLKSDGVSGEAVIQSDYHCVYFKDILGRRQYVDLTADTTETKQWANGDTIHLRLSSFDTPEELAENYGIKLTRTEADVTIQNIPHYPNDPKDVITYMSDESMPLIMNCIAEKIDPEISDWPEDDGDGRRAELVDYMFFYKDDSNTSGNARNKLTFIFHVTNDKMPQGWYTYMTLAYDAVIGYEWTIGQTIQDVQPQAVTLMADGRLLQSFNAPHPNIYGEPIFEYDGVQYCGFQTIEECVNYLMSKSSTFDHLILGENLQQYADER